MTALACLVLSACAGIAPSYHANANNRDPNINDATNFCRWNTPYDFMGLGGAWDRCMASQGWDRD